MREANTETGFFHSSAILLIAGLLTSSALSALSPSFSRSMSPKLFFAPLATAANGLGALLKALKALVLVDVEAAGFAKGDGADPKLDLPKDD